MKRNVIFKVSGIMMAMALAAMTSPVMAQDYPSSTIDTPTTTPPDYSTQQPSDLSTPSTSGDTYMMDSQPRGAQGPIRTEDSAAEARAADQHNPGHRGRMRGYLSRPVGNAGYVGFLNWRENNTDTP